MPLYVYFLAKLERIFKKIQFMSTKIFHQFCSALRIALAGIMIIQRALIIRGTLNDEGT